MSKVRKSRLDGVTGIVELSSQIKTITWPSNISKVEGSQVHFDKVIAEQATALWTEHKIELAAMLASSMALFETERQTLIQEGRVLVNQAGNMVTNPRVATTRDLWSEIIQGRRSLAIHEVAKAGNPVDRQKRNQLAQEIEARFKNGAGEELLN
jgi:hypothetical protein